MWLFILASTHGEYHIVLVDFIVALRRTKGRGRRTLRSPPSPSSGLHLIHPGVSAAAGHDCCRGLYQFRYLVSGAGRLSPVPNVVQLSVFGLVSFAFQSGCWAMVVRFSLLVDRSFVPAATWRFAFSFVGFALTANGSFIFADNGVGYVYR